MWLLLNVGIDHHAGYEEPDAPIHPYNYWFLIGIIESVHALEQEIGCLYDTTAHLKRKHVPFVLL